MNKGIVIKSTGSWYTVKELKNNQLSPEGISDDSRVVPCKIRGNYRIRGIRATNPVTVGDYVDFEIIDEGKSGLITHILERKNYIIRRSSNLSKEYQLLAANVDQAWLMVSLTSPKTYLEFIDRFLVTTEAYSIPVVILFNKIDLYDEGLKEELHYTKYIYENAGYECLEISVKDMINIEKVKKKMKNRLNVIAGNSGVGKSTLLNVFDPSLNLKTKLISEAHKSGTHSTTFAEMFEMPFGGFIIDTPGIRGFGLIDFDKDELFHYFPEIFHASANCKFHNCSHVHEPGCAVIKAVEEGEISESRYISYLNMLEDEGGKYR